MPPELQLARTTPAEGEGEAPRIASDDGFKVLRPYFREIGRLETLTSDQEMQRILLAANLSPTLLDEFLRTLREREALLERAGTSSSAYVATSEQEIGLPPAEFRERMERIQRAESRLHQARNELIQHNLKRVRQIQVSAIRRLRLRSILVPELGSPASPSCISLSGGDT